MNNFFNMDNGFFTFLSKVCDMLFLSIVGVLLCIPIITIGPAYTAMYYATVKVIRRERGYLFREYFKSFRLNFKRAAILGVILTILFAVVIYDLVWSFNALNGSGEKGSILFGVFVAITVLLVCFTLYAFPVLSRFDMTIKQLIKAASFMSMKHIVTTLGMLIVTAIGLLGLYLMPILIFIIPGVIVFVNSLLMERVLKKYMPKNETEEENTKQDEWYLE